MTRPPIVVSYLRFSSVKQSSGNSERRQTEALEDEAAVRRLEERYCKANGLTLDTRMRFADRGVSGHYGRHRSTDRLGAGGLADLLAHVTSGDIPPGSIILVERLNRLTREHPLAGVKMVVDLLTAGVKIVTLFNGAVYDGADDPGTLVPRLMMAMVEVQTGHQSSAEKAAWSADNWKRKRAAAAASKRVMTKTVPGWCRIDKAGRIVSDPKRAAVVRRIYQLAIEGYGMPKICRILNDEKVPTLTTATVAGRASGRWSLSSVGQILKSRAAVGEYTPKSGAAGKKRAAVGDPIPDYYPAVIDQATWDKARGAIAQRTERGRGRSGRTVNVFQGLLRDARTGLPLYVMSNSSGRYVVPTVGSEWHTFPADPFERAVLDQLAEIDPATVTGGDQDGGEVLRLTGQVAEYDRQIADLSEALAGRAVKAVVDRLAVLEEEKAGAVEELVRAKQKAANPVASAWADARSLVGLLDSEDARVRLRAALRRIVAGMVCCFWKRGRVRYALIQVEFDGAEHHRQYVARYRPAWRGHTISGTVSARPEDLWASSVARLNSDRVGDLRGATIDGDFLDRWTWVIDGGIDQQRRTQSDPDTAAKRRAVLDTVAKRRKG